MARREPEGTPLEKAIKSSQVETMTYGYVLFAEETAPALKCESGVVVISNMEIEIWHDGEITDLTFLPDNTAKRHFQRLFK